MITRTLYFEQSFLNTWQKAKANKVEYVNLSKNQFTAIDFPTFEMPDVQILELSYNETEIEKLVIDAAIFPNVEYIFAYQSKIKSFEIKGNLSKLKEINLGENQIKTISLTLLEQCPKLKHLVLSKNELGNPPQSLFENKNGYEELESFIRKLKDGKVKVYQSKIVIVGNGRVGKTCLVKRWLFDKFDKEEKSTHAIQIYHKALEKLAKGEDFDFIQMNIWDFGGQDMYHATHRIFMKTKALFLLVWDMETESLPTCKEDDIEHQNYPIEYWLEYARHENKKNPVLLVQTKVKKEKHTIKRQDNIDKLLNKYGVFKELHIDSSLKKENEESGFEDLQLEIDNYIRKALNNQGETTEIPTSWWSVQLAIQTEQDKQVDTISFDKFTSICHNNHLSDSKDIAILRKYFHDTGVFFVLNDVIILNQKKAIEAIYMIFDRADSYRKFLQKDGIIEGIILEDTIWKAYSEAERALFIDFMLRCEVCFEIEDDRKEEDKWRTFPLKERTFLAPALLPMQKSKAMELTWKNEKNYIRYQFNFLKYGTLQSLIIRSRNYGETGNMWRFGTQLVDDNGGFVLIEGFTAKGTNYIDVHYRDYENSKQLLAKFDNTLLDFGLEFTKSFSDNEVKMKDNKEVSQERFEEVEKNLGNNNNPTKKQVEDMLQKYETFRDTFQVSVETQTNDLIQEIRKNYPMNNADKGVFNGYVNEFISRNDNFNFEKWKVKVITFLDNLMYRLNEEHKIKEKLEYKEIEISLSQEVKKPSSEKTFIIPEPTKEMENKNEKVIPVPEKVEEKDTYILGVDVVGFSGKKTQTQLRIFKKLINLFNTQLEKYKIMADEATVLFAGDGFAVAFSNLTSDKRLIPLKIANNLNEKQSQFEDFELRFAISTGKMDWISFDRGLPQLIGDKVNMFFRLLGKTEDLKVFLSEEYYKDTIHKNENSYLEDYDFIFKKDLEVKHEVKINAYEVQTK
ncbi:MAG: hypothetical protein EAZ44_01180 [Cytophagia bacterium]|nr:MAG: hypothetical protein EAZ44_01180 [Cytophagia bacterium]TAG42169.1 MAG: hypothetical protein EAZ31_06585 [Cytophagia bacterium]